MQFFYTFFTHLNHKKKVASQIFFIHAVQYYTEAYREFVEPISASLRTSNACNVICYNQSTNHKLSIRFGVILYSVYRERFDLISQQTIQLIGCAVEPVNYNWDMSF